MGPVVHQKCVDPDRVEYGVDANASVGPAAYKSVVTGALLQCNMSCITESTWR